MVEQRAIERQPRTRDAGVAGEQPEDRWERGCVRPRLQECAGRGNDSGNDANASAEISSRDNGAMWALTGPAPR